MPVRRQGRFLATLAALVGLCAAGAGCQSSSGYQSEGWSGRSAAAAPSGAPMQMASGTASGTTTARKPLFGFNRSTTQEPALASNTCPTCKVQMGRPVPMPCNCKPGEGSTWQPVQRVEPQPEEIMTTSAQGAVAIDRPQALPMGSSPLPPQINTMPLRPMPMSMRVVMADKDDMKKGAKDDKLPMPAKVAPKVNGPGTGYPELPPPAITQPVHAPREFEKRAYSAYIIEPPDILVVDFRALDDENQPLSGQYLVRMDGTIGLGTLGHIMLAGRTLYEAKDIIARQIQAVRLQKKGLDDIKQALRVDVSNFNSKFYYVVTDGGGYGAQVFRLACTGNETVLDALAQVQGLPAQASKKKIWVARATPGNHEHPTLLPVDWCGIVMRGSAATNYQIFPGDRIFVHSDPLIRTDSFLAKVLSPIERLLGVTLLGTSIANQISNIANAGRGVNTANTNNLGF